MKHKLIALAAALVIGASASTALSTTSVSAAPTTTNQTYMYNFVRKQLVMAMLGTANTSVMAVKMLPIRPLHYKK